MTRLSEIRRGVTDPVATSAWIRWLLDAEPTREGDQFRFTCANGSLVIHGDPSVAVSFDFSEADTSFRGPDPDGVPVDATNDARPSPAEGAVTLDHVRLNCAELSATAEFYCRFGFTLSWCGRGDEELVGAQETPLEGATWLHLSCADGYLSLSQADWQDYGRHSSASGPPRFIHIGLAVTRLKDVVERLDHAGVPYLRGHPAVGENIYVNDPDGEPRLRTNVEVIQYQPGIFRSGHAAPA